MTIQLTEQHYIDYAMAHSQDQIKKGRQRAILWAVLFTVVGCVAIYRGAFMEGVDVGNLPGGRRADDRFSAL